MQWHPEEDAVRLWYMCCTDAQFESGEQSLIASVSSTIWRGELDRWQDETTIGPQCTHLVATTRISIDGGDREFLSQG